MKKAYCDKCGKEIKRGYSISIETENVELMEEVDFNRKKYESGPSYVVGTEPILDTEEETELPVIELQASFLLCEECGEEIESMLEGVTSEILPVKRG